MKIPLRKSYIRLLIIMVLVTLITSGLCIAIIYNVVYKEKKEYLKELCVNQANIIKSINKETKDENKIINILKEQNKNSSILGKTGEYAIGFLRNDSVIFLLDLRRAGYLNISPIPWKSESGMPIKYALSRKTGYLVGPDYSNTKVLAYCTYIHELNWGLVTKMDISEVNDPFQEALLYTILASLILVLVGILAFRKTFDPIIERIVVSENRYRCLFDYSVIPMWEVDFSPVKKQFDKLRESGITNYRTYFENNKNEIKHLTSMVEITAVNQRSVTFFDVNSKDEIIRNILSYFNEDSLEVFKNELAGLAEGITHFETQLPIRTFKGDIKILLFHMSVMPGHENDLSEVLISFVDITKRVKAEEALRNSEANMRSFLDATLESMYMFDKDGIILAANNTAAERLKLSRNEIVGHNFAEFIPENLAVTRMAYLNKVFSTGKPIQFEDYRDRYFFEHNFCPVLQDNEVKAVVSFSRDITERRKTEEAIRVNEEKFRAIALNTPDHILIQDADLKYIMVINPQLGLTENDMLGKTDYDILTRNDAKKLTEIKRRVIESGIPDNLMLPIVALDGSVQFFEGSYIPRRNLQGITDGVIGYFRNVTNHYKMEEALKKSEAQLKELIATKDKFFNIVAHDLKNPFTSLLGSTELLYDNLHLMDSEKIRKLAQILHDSAKSGYAILLNLLDWSRAQTGSLKINPERIDLKCIIDKNISDLKLSLTNKEIKIHSLVKEDIFVLADKNMIDTVLRNLLSNALKFTHRNGNITVDAKIKVKEVIVSVKDSGIGISEENIKKLFRLDTKFQSTGSDKEQGTGLGLKLCKEFVEKQGGKIWVESTVNKGSEFIFSIPIKEN
jgi:PAS domain S-box-containing protein